jgi:hypothetical protein
VKPNPENLPPAATLQKRQFSLASIFILVLILCPAFVAIRDAINIATGGAKSGNFALIPFVLAYALALTLIAFRRRRIDSSDEIIRTLMWCVGRGAVFGMLYFVLLIGPVAFAEQLFTGRVFDWIFVLQVLLVGAAFGAPAGGAAWLFEQRFPGLSKSNVNGNESLDSTDPVANLIGQWGGVDALFTTQACEAVKLAELEAQKLNSEYFGTDHLLLGVLNAGELAATVLTNLNVRVETIRNEIALLVPPTPSGSRAAFPSRPQPNAQSRMHFLKRNH